ncbi:MAG: hypothetical protein J7K69_04755 [Thermotogae bacterium]|nr:hypothetical protein [Thermotogota bacterium]
MIYFVALTILFAILGFLYLNVNIISLILILAMIPFVIYFSREDSKELNTIFLNQSFAYILAFFMSLKWKEFDRVNLYIYFLSLSSYLRIVYLFSRKKLFKFFFWFPIGYVVGDIFYLKFNNPYLFFLGFLLVILIGIRDQKLGRSR